MIEKVTEDPEGIFDPAFKKATLQPLIDQILATMDKEEPVMIIRVEEVDEENERIRVNGYYPDVTIQQVFIMMGEMLGIPEHVLDSMVAVAELQKAVGGRQCGCDSCKSKRAQSIN